MNRKTLIWIGLFAGSTIGSLIPSLWGAGGLSFSSMFFGAVGSFAGIWAGFKLSQRL